jgi:predicted dehydrogenase
MADPMRVGIIGVGWGSVVQAPAFQAVPDYEVVAICSRRPERVAAAAEKLGIAETSTDWREFVRRDDLDLISVCTPVNLHAEQVIAAFAAGKHVLCEKPVAVSEREARQMFDAGEASGKAHAVCFENRWAPERLPVSDMVRTGFLGEAYFMRSTVDTGLWHPTHPLQAEWMYRRDQGGGYLMGLSSHDIDWACSLFGDPESVCADVRSTIPTRRRPDGTELAVDADDTSTLIMRMQSGVHVVINNCVVAAHADSRMVHLAGSNGTITIEGTLMGEHPVVRAAKADEEGMAGVPLSTRSVRSGRELPTRRARAAILALALMLEEWLPAFEGRPAPGVPTLRDGWLSQRIIDAAWRSSEGAGWVDVAPDRPF